MSARFRSDDASAGGTARGVGPGVASSATTDKSPSKASAEPTKVAQAQAYGSRGWKVLPIYEICADGRCACANADCAHPGKHPRIKHGFKSASKDPTQIEEWWQRWPDANVGIATGGDSGLTVVDVDCSNDKAGDINFTKLCAQHGGVPRSARVQTGGGGYHLYFKFDANLRNGTNVLGQAIDVRNEGGYVVAPPSNHASGGTYHWTTSPEADLLPVPDWMRQPQQEHYPTCASRRSDLTLDQVAGALRHVSADDRSRWLDAGVILGRAFDRRDDAWAIYEAWAATSDKFQKDHISNLQRMREMFYTASAAAPPRGGQRLGLGSLISWAQEVGWQLPAPSDALLDKFRFIFPAGKCLYVPTGALWAIESVNAAMPRVLVGTDDRGKPAYQRPSDWLATRRGVHSMVWDPELMQITHDCAARAQGVVEDLGAVMFNTHYPATVKPGDACAAGPWLDHVRRLLPKNEEADHVIAWLAHRVQRPGEKVRHAIVLAGPPGVGKDTVIEAALPAIGQWNSASVAPDAIFGNFNEHVRCVLLRINEVVDLHDVSRFKFHEATKTLIAGTPDYIEVNPKYGTKYFVRNCCGVVMTTNHSATGMYLPADDRRHFVVETVPLAALGTDVERDAYFTRLWHWLLREDGFAHVAAYLLAYDLTTFDPNRPPPKTSAFWRTVAEGARSDEWLSDALVALGDPPLVRATDLRRLVEARGMKPEVVSRGLAPAMARAGYELLRNEARKDGRHETKDDAGRRALTAIYVRAGMPAEKVRELLADQMKF